MEIHVASIKVVANDPQITAKIAAAYGNFSQSGVTTVASEGYLFADVSIAYGELAANRLWVLPITSGQIDLLSDVFGLIQEIVELNNFVLLTHDGTLTDEEFHPIHSFAGTQERVDFLPKQDIGTAADVKVARWIYTMLD